jgi:hypothetical protein
MTTYYVTSYEELMKTVEDANINDLIEYDTGNQESWERYKVIQTDTGKDKCKIKDYYDLIQEDNESIDNY